MAESRQNGITEGVIWKQLLLFFFPILFGTFFQQFYSTVDTIIVGQAVGKQALAAVGVTTPFVNLLVGFFTGLASGAGVVISQYYGSREGEKLNRCGWASSPAWPAAPGWSSPSITAPGREKS